MTKNYDDVGIVTAEVGAFYLSVVKVALKEVQNDLRFLFMHDI